MITSLIFRVSLKGAICPLTGREKRNTTIIIAFLRQVFPQSSIDTTQCITSIFVYNKIQYLVLQGILSGESIDDPALFFPKALNIRLSGRSSDLSRFSEPSHGAWRHSGRYSENPHPASRRDRASQQRVLLRILTAFPFHCNETVSLQHQKLNQR
jgi:hypothetical protein